MDFNDYIKDRVIDVRSIEESRDIKEPELKVRL